MTGIFAQLSPGLEPGLAGKPPSSDTHVLDVPVIGSTVPTTSPPERSNCLRAACTGLCNMNRGAIRNRMRLVQLLLSIGALAFIRPQYNDGFQWITLFVLCHSFVISFVLFWDRRCCGTIVRSLLPLVNWRRLELQYTAGVTLLLYVLSYGLMFAHKGYGGYETCNWISSILSLLTALMYAGETFVQLRDIYDGRSINVQ
uniref:MARVEL domain-containing protein n=1 Tax=Anopheles funestus TaxID=62324 RepID=A0A182RM77_ANOFN